MWGGTGAARGAQELPEEPGSRGSCFGISSEPVNKGWIFPTVPREGGAGWLPSIPASRKRVPRAEFTVSFVNNGISPAAQSLPSAQAVMPWGCGDVVTSQIPVPSWHCWHLSLFSLGLARRISLVQGQGTGDV